MSEQPLTISVVVPTYDRPNYLENCFMSILRQTRLPDEVILVSREDDNPTNERIALLRDTYSKQIPILNPRVDIPGFLPPIVKGIEIASHSVVVFIDDDAEAYHDWLDRMAIYYRSSEVGGVGGRYVNYSAGNELRYEPADIVGRLYWYGRSVGNMYKDTTFDHPVSVDFLIGGNMSYRRSLLQQVRIDPALNENVAFHWEMDVGLQVKALSYRLLFDPRIRVKHFSAPRKIAGVRTVNPEGIFWANFNYSYLMFKYLSLIGKLGYLLYTFGVGSMLSTGLIHSLAMLLRRQRLSWREEVLPSVMGRMAGVCAYFAGKARGRHE